MGDEARQAFLGRFQPQGRGIGFAVLGGVFAEGVDLPGSLLIGAFIATLGLPPVSAQQTQVQARLRPTDHLARFGGEEFVVLIPGTPVQEAQQALTRLQRNLSEALFVHEGREVFVTFSAGVTTWRSGETLEEAMGRADSALYQAKHEGRNRFVVAGDRPASVPGRPRAA